MHLFTLSTSAQRRVEKKISILTKLPGSTVILRSTTFFVSLTLVKIRNYTSRSFIFRLCKAWSKTLSEAELNKETAPQLDLWGSFLHVLGEKKKVLALR